MNIVTLNAEPRPEVGSRKTRRLREQGLVPGIIYGHGEEPVPIKLPVKDLTIAIRHGEHVVELTMSGEKQNLLFKDVQWDTYGIDVLHVDFARVDMNERVQVTVPLRLLGTSKGEQTGGILTPLQTDINIECVVTAIPDELTMEIDELEIGDSLTAGDIKLPDGVELLDDPETAVVSITYVSEVEEEPVEGEEAAEPELIGREGEEGEEAAE